MTKLEQSIKDILKRKGLTLTDLANRIGATPSNLLQSIKRNPKMERVQEIAHALNTTVAEILDEPPTGALGYTIIGGQMYQLNRPAPSMAQIPIYGRYDLLREWITVFIAKSVEGKQPVTTMGIIETLAFFSLVYEPESSLFILSLCYGDKKIDTITYSKLDYAYLHEGDDENNAKWPVDEIVNDIINDLEGYVPTKLAEL